MIARIQLIYDQVKWQELQDSLSNLRISAKRSDLQIKFIILRQKGSSVFGADDCIAKLQLQEETI